MNAHYRRTLVALGAVLVGLIVATTVAGSAAAEAKARVDRLAEESMARTQEAAAERLRTQKLRAAMVPVYQFLEAWKSVARVREKDAADTVRSEIEAIAQRQLGLVTDNAITPQPDRYVFQGSAMRVQRVTLRASGRDINALLTWIGKVEERYPAAVVETCEFSSNIGGNTALTIRLVQPLEEPNTRRAAVLPADRALSDAITLVPWLRYTPRSVKAASAVGVERNALQPAIRHERTAPVIVPDDRDELTPRIEDVLCSRLRSVIRGSTPMIVVDGRVYRIGDELFVGASRERLLPDSRTKLKSIGDDRLTLQVVSSGTAPNGPCDVIYLLPAFLRAR